MHCWRRKRWIVSRPNRRISLSRRWSRHQQQQTTRHFRQGSWALGAEEMASGFRGFEADGTSFEESGFDAGSAVDSSRRFRHHRWRTAIPAPGIAVLSEHQRSKHLHHVFSCRDLLSTVGSNGHFPIQTYAWLRPTAERRPRHKKTRWRCLDIWCSHKNSETSDSRRWNWPAVVSKTSDGQNSKQPTQTPRKKSHQPRVHQIPKPSPPLAPSLFQGCFVLSAVCY